jgi:hypothetical protein
VLNVIYDKRIGKLLAVSGHNAGTAKHIKYIQLILLQLLLNNVDALPDEAQQCPFVAQIGNDLLCQERLILRLKQGQLSTKQRKWLTPLTPLWRGRSSRWATQLHISIK